MSSELPEIELEPLAESRQEAAKILRCPCGCRFVWKPGDPLTAGSLMSVPCWACGLHLPLTPEVEVRAPRADRGTAATFAAIVSLARELVANADDLNCLVTTAPGARARVALGQLSGVVRIVALELELGLRGRRLGHYVPREGADKPIAPIEDCSPVVQRRRESRAPVAPAFPPDVGKLGTAGEQHSHAAASNEAREHGLSSEMESRG